jgi:hypothetical protein
MRSPRWLLLALSLAGCGSGGSPRDAGGDTGMADRPGPDGGGGPDARPDDGAVPRDDNPIIDRPSAARYQCRIARDRTDHSPRNWGLVPPALVKTAQGKLFLARLETTGDYLFNGPPPQVTVSTLDVAGTFGTPTTIPLANSLEGSAIAAAARGDGLLVLWVDDGKLRLAAFDAAGQIVLAARDVLDHVDAGSNPALALGPDGNYGLAYAPQLSLGSREVRFAVLDANGTVKAAPRVMSGPGASFASPAPAIAATSYGYAMLWRDPSSMAGGIDFAAATVSGVEVVPRHRVSAAVELGLSVGGVGGFESPQSALLPNGDGYLAAWTEAKRSEFTASGSVVRLARLDAEGNRLGEAASMRRFQYDVDEVEPTLVPFGDAVAVLWGHGSHIYICGGCVPDHRVDLLLVDPATLAPVGNLVSLTNGGDPRGGGLLRRQVGVLGSSLLTTYLLTFHTSAKPGSAAFDCSKN